MESFMVIPPIKANYKFCKRLYEVFTTFFNLCDEAKKLRNNILSNQNIHTIYFYFKNAQAYEKILDLLEANKSTDYSNKIINTAEYIIGRQNFETPSEKEIKKITYYNKGKDISLVNVRTKEYLKENVLQYAREKGKICMDILTKALPKEQKEKFEEYFKNEQYATLLAEMKKLGIYEGF